MQFDINLLIMILRIQGRSGLKRMLSVPRRDIERICAKTGADVDAALAQRDQLAEQSVQFVESLTTKEWQDPDASLISVSF